MELVRRSSYRLGRRLKSSAKARLDYITYLNEQGRATGKNGNVPEIPGRISMRFSLGGEMVADIAAFTRQYLSALFQLGGAYENRVAITQSLSAEYALGGRFRMNIFPPVTFAATMQGGGEMGMGISLPRYISGLMEGGGALSVNVGNPQVLGALMQGGGAMTAGISLYAPLLPETQAIVDAMDVEPSAGRKQVINTAVSDLIDAGLWAKLDMLYVFAAHAEQAGRVMWRNPAIIATRHNVATFETDLGFKGNGTSMYLTLNWLFTDAIAGSRIGINWNYHLGAKAFDHPGTNDQILGADTLDTVSNFVGTYHPSFSGGAFGGIGYSGGSPIYGYSNADLNNHTVITVNGDNKDDLIAYQNGVLRGPPTANGGAALIDADPSDTLYVLRAATQYYSGGVQLVHAGASLTGTEVSDLYAILGTYLSAVAP